MSDDAKKILADVENGKLPDIKTGAGKKGKDLTRVRYNRSFGQESETPLREYRAYHGLTRSDEKKKPDSSSAPKVAVKERKKEKDSKR